MRRYDRIKPELHEGFYVDQSHWAKPSLELLFNERSGAIVRDYSGNGFHGVTFGEPNWSAGGIQLDGVNDRLRIDHNATLNLNFGFSISIDVDLFAVNTNAGLICKYNGESSTNGTSGWHLRLAGANTFRFAKSGVFLNFTRSGIKQTLDIVYSVSDTLLSIYKDGVLTQQFSVAFAESTSTFPITVGARSMTDSTFCSESLRRVSIYPYALTADQVRSLYEAPYQRYVRKTYRYFSIPKNSMIYRRVIDGSPFAGGVY